jgi:hypothetical protein
LIWLEQVRDATRVRNEQVFKDAFLEYLMTLQQRNTTYPSPITVSDCIGECGRLATVKIVKHCNTCPEREDCNCDPGWCHLCLYNWWCVRNKARLEMEVGADLAWQAQCPTCRVFFCLRDVLPLTEARLDAEEPAGSGTGGLVDHF